MHALRPLRVVFRAARGGRVAVLAVVEARQPGIQVVLYGLDAAAAAQVAVGAGLGVGRAAERPARRLGDDVDDTAGRVGAVEAGRSEERRVGKEGVSPGKS